MVFGSCLNLVPEVCVQGFLVDPVRRHQLVIVSSLNLVPEVCVQNFLGDLVWVVMISAVKLGRRKNHSSAYKRGKNMKFSISRSEVETWFWFAKLNVVS